MRYYQPIFTTPLQALKSPRKCASLKIVQGFTVSRIGSRHGDTSNGLTVDYSNTEGKVKQNFSKGTHIDRHKLSTSQLDGACASLPLLGHLQSVYDEHVAEFAATRGFPSHVCATPAEQCLCRVPAARR